MHSIVPSINANKTSPRPPLPAGRGEKNAQFAKCVFAPPRPTRENAENQPTTGTH